MADDAQSAEVDDELADAIAEDPEAVAAFVRRLDVVNELLDVAALGVEAADDEMVSSVAENAATLGESADGLAEDGTPRLAAAVGDRGDELADAVETVADLQRDGVLDQLVELGDIVALATEAADDEMVSSVAGTAGSLGELADEAADPETVRGARTLLRALGDAGDPDATYREVGPLGLVRALRDPEVKRGMAFLIAVARGIGREVDPGTE
ncbi:MAG: DUF1641 domain-containing protein [Haloplanus sp.]